MRKHLIALTDGQRLLRKRGQQISIRVRDLSSELFVLHSSLRDFWYLCQRVCPCVPARENYLGLSARPEFLPNSLARSRLSIERCGWLFLRQPIAHIHL